MNQIAQDIVGNFMRNLAVDTVMVYWHAQEHNIAVVGISFTFTHEQSHSVVNRDSHDLVVRLNKFAAHTTSA